MVEFFLFTAEQEQIARAFSQRSLPYRFCIEDKDY
jgi:hypothetical protein